MVLRVPTISFTEHDLALPAAWACSLRYQNIARIAELHTDPHSRCQLQPTVLDMEQNKDQ